MFARTLTKAVLYGTGGVALAGLLTVAFLLIAAGIEHRIPLEFPKPTGTFAVGRTTLHWVDRSPQNERELLAWIWYPARACQGKQAEYLPPA